MEGEREMIEMKASHQERDPDKDPEQHLEAHFAARNYERGLEN